MKLPAGNNFSLAGGHGVFPWLAPLPQARWSTDPQSFKGADQPPIQNRTANPEALLFPSPREGLHVAASSESSMANRRPRFLVADDDRGIRYLVSTVLAGEGFDVNAVSDGEYAWEALFREPYDLLVTDIEMPRLSGIELIARIRETDLSLPIIIASATFPDRGVPDDPPNQVAAVLAKPFGILQLLNAVRHGLETARRDTIAGPRTVRRLFPDPPPTQR